jgi:hypothetical protein
MDCFAPLAMTAENDVKWSAKLGDDLDFANDRFVEGGHFLGGNPVFQMCGAAGFLNIIFFQKIASDLERVT